MERRHPGVVKGMSETSQAAHSTAQRGAKQIAYRIYLQVKDAGQDGLTRDELVQCFQALNVEYSTVTARVRSLVFSGLLTDGPDTRLTRKNHQAGVLRSVSGLDFKTVYREPPRAGHRCSDSEREFLDHCHSLDTAIRASTFPELEELDASKLLWDYFRELRTNVGFRDLLGNCSWCHVASCGGTCVT